jgi:iron complex outermembrane receptor protein
MSRRILLACNKHSWLYGIVGCYTTIIALTANATPNSDNINEILSLSLEELLSIRIEGASVRTVGFSIAPESANPFNLNLSRTPASVEIIEQNTIRARGLKNVIEAAENLVGVISGDTPGDPYSFSMRGFSGNSVNLLYDGISLGLSSLNMRPLGTYHLERLEIIKGASSLHGGEGGAGGAINLISSKPTLNGSQKSSALISYGNYNSSTINLDVAGPLTTDSAYRVVIANNMSEGWIYDTHSNSLNITASTVT